MAWFLALLGVFVVLVAVFVRPLLSRPVPWAPVSASKAVALLEGQREQVLRKLKDLEGERESGAVVAAEYEEMRKTFLTEAALLKRRIDALQQGTTAAPTTGEESA
ncbi:MAG: hypothetical protein AAF581_02850 [Planctomycetota bacterium]